MLSEIVTWILAIEALSFAALIFCRPVLWRLPDSGLGVSKVLGLYGFGFSCWALSLVGGVGLTRPLLIILFTVVLVAAAVRARQQPLPNISKTRFWLVEGVFIGSFLLFVIVRALNPEIFWGEKPMDFTFFNYFMRVEHLPPEDPWAAGQRMYYYYLGTLIFSLLAKLLGVAPGVAYNLAVGTVAGLFGAASSSLFSILVRKPWMSALSAVAITCFANFEVLYLVFVRGEDIDFDSFWASSRVFTSPAFIEYPSWSFLFADLHAHVITLPWTVCLLVAGTRIFSRSNERRDDLGPPVLYGLILGGLVALNTWDFLSYSVYSGVLLCALFVRDVSSGYPVVVAGRRLLRDSLVIAAAAVPFAALFYSSAMRPGAAWTGPVFADFNTPWQFFRLFGHWLLLLFIAGTVVLARARRLENTTGMLKFSLIAFLTIIPPLMVFPRIISGQGEIPWGIISIASVLVLFGSLLAVLQFRKDRAFFAGTALVTAGMLMVPAEINFLMDRMNTIFKVYNSIGTLFACSALALLPLAFAGLRRQRGFNLNAIHSSILSTSAALILALPAVAFVINVVGIVKMERVKTVRPSIDGEKFLAVERPNELRLYEWLRKNVPGTPTMIEAFGNSYAQYTRVSMYTGIPTLLGWDYHVKQRGTIPEVVERRRRDLETIYGGVDVTAALKLLEGYGVDLIIVGDVERQTYGEMGVAKFARLPEVFPLLFRSGRVSVFTTQYSALNPNRNLYLTARNRAQIEGAFRR